MEIRIPLNRSHILAVLVAAMSALIRGASTLRFTTQEVNNKKRPVVLSRDELVELQQAHLEATASVQALREMVEDALAQMPREDVAAMQLRDALTAIERRTLH